MNKSLIIISGGFDPIHRGHINLFKESAINGDVVVCLNSDSWLSRKKGKPFMSWEDRAIVAGSIKGVIDVIQMDDSDNSCCDGILKVHKKYKDVYSKIYLANGGDRTASNVPKAENELCKILGIKSIWGVGGHKVQSSSNIIKEWGK